MFARLSVVMAASATLCVACTSLPRDKELLDRFAQRRTEFNTLMMSLERDNVREMSGRGRSYSRTDTIEPLDARTMASYRVLFEVLGLQQVYDFPQERRHRYLELTAASRNGLLSLASKGYAYSDLSPASRGGAIVASLDDSQMDTGDEFRHIEGNWYLYLRKRSNN
ncbi:MAG TPA: hypothetical protein VJS92_10950 [Candidatus Polarisedimenticolaceae bacterium]|nr:hypothetical protein [Candidatus Polarisedimenticolaceae bacterium]